MPVSDLSHALTPASGPATSCPGQAQPTRTAAISVRVGTEPRRCQSLFAPFYTAKARNLSLRQGSPQTCCSYAYTHPGGGNLPKENFLPAGTPGLNTSLHMADYTHAKWNLLRRIEHGNTTTGAVPKVAHALRSGHKIAIWCADTARWYTAKVVDSAPQRGTQHTVKYDSDKSNHHTHDLMPISYSE